jgi:hypothetical protein
MLWLAHWEYAEHRYIYLLKQRWRTYLSITCDIRSRLRTSPPSGVVYRLPRFRGRSYFLCFFSIKSGAVIWYPLSWFLSPVPILPFLIGSGLLLNYHLKNGHHSFCSLGRPQLTVPERKEFACLLRIGY